MLENKYVERVEYLDFLKRSMNKPIIKVVSGVRRSGKSTLLKLFQNYLLDEGVSPDAIHFINFEDMAYRHLLDYEELYNYLNERLVDDEMNYIILDEVQHVRNFEKVVDSFHIKDNVDIYITGSNAYFLSGELATLLSGRYIELKILPLSFKEFKSWHTQNNYSLSNEDLFNKYLKSSFPYTLFVDNDSELLDYLQGIYSTVVLLDIVKRLNIQDVRILERVIQTLMSSIGSLVNINKIKNILKSNGLSISNNTLDRYIKGITDSLIMYEARRFDIHGRNLLETNAKYYSVDLGLRRLLVPDRLEDYGHIIENIVYLELIRRGGNVYVGVNNSLEVDFVVVKADQSLEYYQVALTTLDSNVLERELRSLKTINDNHPKYLITLDTFNKDANYGGIQKLNLIDWLLK